MTPSLKRSRGADDLECSPSHLKKTTGSPSREYLAELSLQHEHYNKELFAKLEADEKRRGKSYKDALAAAQAEHDRIRRAAQRAQEWNLLQAEKAKQQQEDEQAREIERQKHAQLEQEIADRRRRAEEAHRLEELRKQAELEQKQHDEEAKRRAERESEDARQVEEKRKKEEEDAQRAAEAVANKAEQPKDTPASQANGVIHPPTSGDRADTLRASSQQSKEDEHKRYLELHKWLKTMRKDVERDVKKDPQMKALLGDWRRDIRKRVGQLTVEKNASVVPRKKILEILNKAKAYQKVTVDVRQCFPNGAPAGLTDVSAQVSGLLIYYLNIFAKAVISQWASEGSAKIEAADPPGILATYIFAVDDTKIQGQPLIDILVAKVHKVCPLVFGIYGNDQTAKGRERLGWQREEDPRTGQKTQWTTEQRHNERMFGLGAGYASISLRDFSKAPMANPYPPVNYWRAIAQIVNTPAADITQSHLIVLKGLIENSVERFARFFRKAAQVALRTALIDFPEKAPQSPAKVGLTSLPEILSRNHGINL